MTLEQLGDALGVALFFAVVELVLLVILFILHRMDHAELEGLSQRMRICEVDLGKLRRAGQTNVRPGRVEPPGVRFTPSDRVAGHPAKFYSIVPNDDGTVDVYIPVEWAKYETVDGIYDHDLTVSAVRGIVPWEGLEEDIRAHYDDWISSGIRITF